MAKKYTRYTKEILEPIVKSSISIREVLSKLDLKFTGGNHQNMKDRIKQFEIDTSHMKGCAHNKGTIVYNDISYILVENSVYSSGAPRGTDQVKKLLFKNSLKEKCCEECGISSWNGLEAPLELHHINGIRVDNRIENLQILCCNCHAQTDNYSGKNKN